MENLVFYKHKNFYDFSSKSTCKFSRFRQISTTHKESFIKFSKLFGHPKFFIDTSKKISQKIENFCVFELQPYKKIDFVENWFCVKFPFFLNFFFFLVFPGAFENYWKIQKMISPMHQLDLFSYRKPPPKFEIEALFRHVLVYTDTKKKIHTILAIICLIFYHGLKIHFSKKIFLFVMWRLRQFRNLLNFVHIKQVVKLITIEKINRKLRLRILSLHRDL
ncbi:Uncharacterized protein FWK35_00002504 [Aphis craccivora]|uniref:Uncharacterized protein n=1 Tax=Aphis craccivora TaxID=307492 RepID=A0A6G0ZAP1_APHCR|nr:Uncharacterized protein FWK35_00002504 [Aphis craccivora]